MYDQLAMMAVSRNRKCTCMCVCGPSLICTSFMWTPGLSKYFNCCVVNECTKVQNPRYIDVTLNAYTSA